MLPLGPGSDYRNLSADSTGRMWIVLPGPAGRMWIVLPGPASPILAEYGRRVGGLGPGLTSESADALSGCPANDSSAGSQVFMAPTGVPV
jgi:hypothetical protein